jgi:hypothetical protein
VCEVKRYRFKGAAGEYVYSGEFDRVTAERDALQQRLNAADQQNDDLVRELANVRQGPCKLIVGDELP